MAKLLSILIIGLIFESAGVVSLKIGITQIGDMNAVSVAELVKLVFDRGLTLEPPRNPDGIAKPIADGILGGPHTLDGLLDIARTAGVTRSHVPLTSDLLISPRRSCRSMKTE